MKKLLTSLSLILGSFLNHQVLSQPVVRGGPSAPGKTPQDIELRIRRIEERLLPPIAIQGEGSVSMKLADRMQFYKTPGVSIAFIDSGRIEWARGYGVREVGRNLPITTETLFQAGSISKPVSAMIALQLVQRGRLVLDEDVNKKIVSWKVPENEFTREQKVTLRRILSHNAGLTNHAVGNYTSGDRLPTLLQILDGEKPANTGPIRVDVVPGSVWRYSGGGYTVLQQLIIDVGGKPFETQAQEVIFDRLKMIHSTFKQPLSDKFRGLAAVGHNRAGEKLDGNWIIFPEMAAAGMWTTPSDLARFALELHKPTNGRSNKVLSAAMSDQMLTRQFGSWGLGLEVDGDGDSVHYSHGGDTEGYKCFMVMYQNGQGVVIMTNSERGDRLVDEILRSVAKEYGWSDYKPKLKTLAKIDPKVFADYIGLYQFEFSPDFVLTIGTESGNLTTELKQPTGQSKSELYPESETRFFRKDVDVEVTFYRDVSGRVTHLIFCQDGQDYRVNRVK